MSLIHVDTQLADPVFNLALNVLYLIFLWPWLNLALDCFLPGSQLPRERALSWWSLEWVIWFPLYCWKTLIGKLKDSFSWHLEEQQDCVWFFSNSEECQEIYDWIFLVNNHGRRGWEHISQVFIFPLWQISNAIIQIKRRCFLSEIEIVPFHSSLAFSHSNYFLT